MPTLSKLQSAYLAGLIDGEGYIGILKVKKGDKKDWSSLRDIHYVPVIKVAMTNKDIIQWLYRSFGGTFETRKPHHNAKESYCWSMRKHQVIDFLKYIHPYSKVKKEQIKTLLSSPSGKTGFPISDEVQNRRKDLCDKIAVLNQRGSLRD